MAATTSGALKARLEALTLGVAVFRDKAPDGQAMPYITVSEGVSVVPDHNQFDNSTVTELAQVDVWQPWKNVSTGAVVESYTLPGQVLAGLSGVSLPAAPTHVYGVTVDSSVRILEADLNVVHHAITVRIRRAR
jgi:hypothetical protein